MVTKLDRLGRSVRNLKKIADDLQGRHFGLRALSQGIDTTTPGGRLFFRSPRPSGSPGRRSTGTSPTPTPHRQRSSARAAVVSALAAPAGHHRNWLAGLEEARVWLASACRCSSSSSLLV